MFDFLSSSWGSLMDMLPDNLNPMNLIPDELNPFNAGKSLLEEGASLAPKVSDYVREQMAKQASGLPLPKTTRFGTIIPDYARNATPISGQYMRDSSGNLQKISREMAASGVFGGVKPALNQGIFAPNTPLPNAQAGILGDIYPEILPSDPLFDSTTLKATGKEEAGETEETEEEKKEREARNKALMDILQQSAKNEQTNQPSINPPSASAGRGAQPIQLTATDMRTIGGNTGNANRTFGILGG